KTSSKHAVQELQTMVYTLRDQDESTEPLPDLDQFPQLVDQADSTEQTVTLEITGEPTPASTAIALPLYRTAQEALSNTRKHAGTDIPVHVQLHYDRHNVTLSITENGIAYKPVLSGTGTGLQCMQERLQAVNGTLEYGSNTPYGWKVIACVPLL